MKNKFFCLIATFLCCIVIAKAQGVSVGIINFKAGVGLTQQDIDGVSAIFTTYIINPSEYTLVERNQIDKIIEEQKLQRSNLTDSDMVRVGKIMNLSFIIIGDINLVMGEYNIDVRLINVEDGNIVATEGASWSSGMSYREVMQKIAERLKSKITIPKTTDRVDVNETVKVLNRAIQNELWDKAFECAQKLQELIPKHYAPMIVKGILSPMINFNKVEILNVINSLNDALLLIDKNNFRPFEDVSDVSITILPNNYGAIIKTIYQCMVSNYMRIDMLDKAVVYQKKIIDIDTDIIASTNQPERMLSAYKDYLLYSTIQVIHGKNYEEAINMVNVAIEILKSVEHEYPDSCKIALAECYDQQSQLYLRMYHNTGAPSNINQWNSKYRESMNKAAQYGNKNAINTLSYYGIRY